MTEAMQGQPERVLGYTQCSLHCVEVFSATRDGSHNPKLVFTFSVGILKPFDKLKFN